MIYIIKVITHKIIIKTLIKKAPPAPSLMLSPVFLLVFPAAITNLATPGDEGLLLILVLPLREGKKKLPLLGKPSGKKSAVFLTLFKMPLTPPLYLNICPILQGVFFKRVFEH